MDVVQVSMCTKKKYGSMSHHARFPGCPDIWYNDS